MTGVQTCALPISDLEQRETVIKLLTRGPAGMTLTAGGSRLLSSASQIVVLGAEAHAAVRAAQGAPEQLRVVATSTVAEFVIGPLMEAFTRRYPGSVEVSVGVAVTKEMGVLVANRLADVAISPGVPDDPALAVVTEIGRASCRERVSVVV